VVNAEDVRRSLALLGIRPGDTVLFHSSLKSFGRVENGPDDVIDGFLAAVGETGTVVAPTFTMKDFENAYRTWHLDKPSDTGLITEVFRRRPQARRSDQATHAVAAIGADAVELTATHGQTGRRHGIYGDTPFAADSPWQKLYDRNAHVIMAGVGFESLTLRHLCEYTLVDRALTHARKQGRYEEAVASICSFEDRARRSDTLFWLYLDHEHFEEYIRAKGLVQETLCGEATLLHIRSKPVCDSVIKAAWEQPEHWLPPYAAAWLRRWR